MPAGGSPTRFGWRRALGTYLVFAAGVVAATWPLALHPATLWPPHHDARVFTWVMASLARRLVSHPLALFHGNAFYPAGESLAYSELLLPPALLGSPGFLWGNPILTYNLLLMTLWPLNGLAMAWVAHRLTGSRAGAWLAGTVFCLSPYFTEYYLEFQMLLAALLPVALFAWVRWLETQARGWLAVALGGLTLQGLTSWYYMIILGLGLATLGLGFLCLRWRGWRWRSLVDLAIGGLGVAAVLLPFALPYWAVHTEYRYDRGVAETATHYADLASFIEAGRRSLLYRFAPSGHVAETAPFVGVTVLVLAAVSLSWLGPAGPGAAPSVPLARIRRGLATALCACVPVLVGMALVRPLRFRIGRIALHVGMETFLDLAVLLGFALLVVEGWAAVRRGADRRLAEADWVRLLLLLTGVLALLALGPVVHLARHEVGRAPYLALYHVLLPLHVVRVTVRFAVLSVAGLALLGAFGLRLVEERLRRRAGWRHALVAGVFALLALEYAVEPADYEPVSAAPRPVDLVLRADPADVAVLEWPINVAESDADAMVRSLQHGKRLVNGLSGVVPAFMSDLSRRLSTPADPFPGAAAREALRRIYPLRYLVVRLDDLAIETEWRPVWLGLRQQPPRPLVFIGSFGDADLYRVDPLPESGLRVERWVSHEFVRTHPVLDLTLRPRARGPDLEQWVEVALNGWPVQRVAIDRDTTARVTLPPPLYRAMPNTVTLSYGYARPPAARDRRYWIGTTGVVAPGDLRVVSVGQSHGSASAIQLNGVELSRNRRGYNLAALDRAGRLVTAAAFDTFLRDEASAQLAAWVASLAPGAIVAGAVRDEGSGRLTAAAVHALRELGVAGDLRGHFRESHAFVGVKGATPGAALEALGPRPIELTLGQVELTPARGETRLGFELTEFVLERR